MMHFHAWEGLMKKSLVWVLCAFAALSLAACSGSGSGASSAAASSQAASSEAAPSDASSGNTSEGASAETSGNKADSSASGATPTIDEIKKRGEFVTMTATGFPPFEYLGADGQPAGVDVDMGKLVADKLGVKYKVLDMDFGLLVEALKNGKGDMIAAGMTVTPEREEQVDFTDTYAQAGQAILVPADSTIAGADDLKKDGVTVTVQANTTGDLYVQNDLGIASPLQFKNAVECASALAAGKADAAVIDDVAAKALVKTYDGKLKVLPELATKEDYAFAIAKGHEDLVEFINGVIEEAKADGTIDKLMEQHTEASSQG